ncbi:MAG: hypothetical protein IH820_17190, partial [Bacteroidetes bacterium]|nr:hypothetical protein [Bacteroidota bacterium]
MTEDFSWDALPEVAKERWEEMVAYSSTVENQLSKAKASRAKAETERQRIARQYRSEGKEEALKIRSTTDKVKTILLADAYEQEQRLRGKGDAEALGIYAEAYERDEEFYSFIRTLEAYKLSLKENT